LISDNKTGRNIGIFKHDEAMLELADGFLSRGDGSLK
jgi:hypothetical protein